MASNKRHLKVSKDFYDFLLKFRVNRVKSDMEMKNIPICYLPDIIVKYFKINNDSYLDLVNMEIKNGNS